MARRYQRPSFFRRLSWAGIAIALLRYYRVLLIVAPVGLILILIGAMEFAAARKAGGEPTLDLEGYLIERAKDPDIGVVRVDAVVFDYTALRWTLTPQGWVDDYYIPIKRAAAPDADATELVLRNSSRTLYRYIEETNRLRSKRAVANYRRSRLKRMRKPGPMYVEAVGTITANDFAGALPTAQDSLASRILVVEQRDPGSRTAAGGLVFMGLGLLMFIATGAAVLSLGDRGSLRPRRAAPRPKPAERRLVLSHKSPEQAAREQLAEVSDPRFRRWKPRVGGRDLRVVPGESVQAAIDRAEDGDRVVIASGFYQEDLKLSRDIALVAEGEVIIRSQAGMALKSFAACALIEGLHFMNDAGEWYCVLAAEGCLNATRCKISSVGAGIGAWGEGALVLHECEIQGVEGSGVYMQASAALLAYRNTLTECGHGFSLSGDAAVVLGNRVRAKHHAFEGEDSGELTIIGNLGQTEGCHAATFERCQGVRLRDNRLRGGKKAGLFLEECSAVRAENNTLVQSGFGLEAHHVTELRFAGNGIIEPRRIGAYLKDCPGVILERNGFWEGRDDGVYVEDCEGATLKGNELLSHEGRGVVVENCAASLRDNRIEGNAAAGVRARKSAAVTLHDNCIENNEGRAKADRSSTIHQDTP